MSFQSACLVYNPASGRRRGAREKKVAEARETLQRWIPHVDLAATAARGDAARLAAEATAQGCELVIACGGDGTINEVVRGIVGSGAALMVLPAGTANVLAEEVGIPADPAAAARTFPELKPYPVPLGVVRYSEPEPGERHFLLMCGVGVDANIIYHLNTQLKAYLGQGAYFLGSIEQLQRKFSPFRICIDGEEQQSTFTLMSKSSVYGGKLVMTPHANLFRDEFEVVVFHAESPLRYLGYLVQIATQTLPHFDGVTFHRARRVELIGESDDPVYIEVDGELAGRLPATVEIASQRLNLLLPPAYEESCREAPARDDSWFRIFK